MAAMGRFRKAGRALRLPVSCSCTLRTDHCVGAGHTCGTDVQYQRGLLVYQQGMMLGEFELFVGRREGIPWGILSSQLDRDGARGAHGTHARNLRAVCESATSKGKSALHCVHTDILELYISSDFRKPR